MRRTSGVSPDCNVARANQLTFTVLKPEDEGLTPEPAFSLPPEDAQEFMDELWRTGFRPSEGSGSAGSLAATERHLEDMRRLVFEKPEPQTRVSIAPPTKQDWERVLKGKNELD